MKISIIGSAEMGSCLAAKLVALRHNVSLASSRGPASLANLTKAIGARSATVEEAVVHQEVVIVSIPLKNVVHLPRNLFSGLPQNVVVIDTMNYYPTLRDGAIPRLEATGIDSLWVQEQLGAPVVKVFNAILATSLKGKAKASGEKNRVAIAVAGDSSRAKNLVFKLIDELGFDFFDTGTIAESWKQQPGSPIYCRDITVDEIKRRKDGMNTGWPDMRASILGKRKTDEALMATDYPAYLKSLQD